MNIIIVGAGKVGSSLAQQLRVEGHDITLVDIDRDVLESLVGSLDVQGVHGNGTSYRVLQDAGLNQADLLIAVTGHDEINMLSCLVARKASQCQVIARVRDPGYYEDIDFIKGELGLAMVINPEMQTAQDIYRLLRIPSVLEVDTFEKSRVNMLCFRLEEDSPLNGKNMIEINTMINGRMLVCIRERNGSIVIPYGNTELAAGDKISVIIPTEQLASVLRQLKMNKKPARSAIICGGSSTAEYLASMLVQGGVKVKMIEWRRPRCEELADRVPGMDIICGDCGDKQLLAEEGLTRTDSFICLTNLDEVNIMLALYASQVSQAKVVTKISRIDFEEVVDTLNLGSVVHPKNITAENIIRFVRALGNAKGNNVETLYRLAEGKVEAMEFVVQTGLSITGKRLMDLKLKKGLLVASITRAGKILTPTGQDTIEPGDIVVIITTSLGIRDLSDIVVS